jgi:ABC-type transport system involved in multi-copper enzyme maturation permease subunit
MMLQNVIYNEHIKIFKRRMLWVELVLMVLLVMGIQITLFAILKGDVIPAEERIIFNQMITWPTGLSNILNYAGGDAFGGLFIIILVGAITAQEYTWRTLHLWLSRGIPRSLLMIGKFASFLLPALVIVLSAVFAGGIVTALFSIHLNGSLQHEQINIVNLGLSILRTTYTLLPYGALTFLLAVASRSTAAAISGGLAYVLLLEDILIQVLGLLEEPISQLMDFLPGSMVKILMSLNQAPVEGVNTGSMTPLNAAIGIGAWTLFFFGLSLIIFHRQDLSE